MPVKIKEKLPSKMCFLCGDSTSDYIVFQNGCVCKNCQKSDKFKEMQNE
jgi:hypothetical protein